MSLGASTRVFSYRPTPNLQLSSNVNAVEYGNNLTFTFSSMGDPGEPVVTGQVTFFYDGINQIGATQTLINGVASVTTTTIPAGTHTIKAVYNGSSY